MWPKGEAQHVRAAPDRCSLRQSLATSLTSHVQSLRDHVGRISQVQDACSVGLGGGQEMCLQGVAAWTRVGVLGNSPLWGLLVSDIALSV